jgi:fructose-bisphosphate aldolase class II
LRFRMASGQTESLEALRELRKGIAKVNIGFEIRQAYESALGGSGSVAAAQDAVYERTCWLIRDYFGLAGSRKLLTT